MTTQLIQQFTTGQTVRVVRLHGTAPQAEERYQTVRRAGATGTIASRDFAHDAAWYMKHETGDPNDMEIGIYLADELEPYTPPAIQPSALALTRPAAELGLNLWRAVGTLADVEQASDHAEGLQEALEALPESDPLWQGKGEEGADLREQVLTAVREIAEQLRMRRVDAKEDESRAFSWLYEVFEGRRLPPPLPAMRGKEGGNGSKA
jgi:hypothetical protein